MSYSFVCRFAATETMKIAVYGYFLNSSVEKYTKFMPPRQIRICPVSFTVLLHWNLPLALPDQ